MCSSGWDSNDAAVVCRQLGYQSTDASKYRYNNLCNSCYCKPELAREIQIYIPLAHQMISELNLHGAIMHI